jgi:hypothetical protein
LVAQLRQRETSSDKLPCSRGWQREKDSTACTARAVLQSTRRPGRRARGLAHPDVAVLNVRSPMVGYGPSLLHCNGVMWLPPRQTMSLWSSAKRCLPVMPAPQISLDSSVWLPCSGCIEFRRVGAI